MNLPKDFCGVVWWRIMTVWPMPGNINQFALQAECHEARHRLTTALYTENAAAARRNYADGSRRGMPEARCGTIRGFCVTDSDCHASHARRNELRRPCVAEDHPARLVMGHSGERVKGRSLLFCPFLTQSRKPPASASAGVYHSAMITEPQAASCDWPSNAR
jgi:hypothetical protein